MYVLGKGVPEGVSEVLKIIKSTTHRKLKEESQNDQYKKCFVFEDLQGGSKQKFIPFMVYDLAI